MCREQSFGAPHGYHRNPSSTGRSPATGARNSHFNVFGRVKTSSTQSQIDRPHGPVETIALSSVSHAISTPAGTKERLLIRLLHVKLPEFEGHDLMCSVSVMPAKEVPSGVKPVALFKKECALQKGAMEVIMDVGEALLKEPCSIRLKFRCNSKSQAVAEVTKVIPQAATQLTLQNPFWSEAAGAATLEVLRLIPGSACDGFIRTLCSEIEQRQQRSTTGTEPDSEVDNLCTGVKELCSSTSARPALQTLGLHLLNSIAGLGRLDAAEALVLQGVEPNVETVLAAENAGSFDLAHRLVQRVQPQVAGTRAKDAGLQLVWALRQKLPGLAQEILEHSPIALRNLPCKPGSPAARMAYECGALSVLAELIKRGDPLPAPVGELLAEARDAGNVSLAKACLSKAQDLNADDAVRICLGHESLDRRLIRAPTSVVRQALEARWRVQSSSHDRPASSAPTRAAGPPAELAECSICYEPLHLCHPTVFLNASGLRTCQHLFCEACAEGVTKRRNAIEEMLDFDIQGRSSNCPMCRCTFSETARLPDPTIDPCAFFQYSCLPEAGTSSEASKDPRKNLRLTKKAACDALCAVLPVDPDSFQEEFANELWPEWTHGKEASAAGFLTEAEFAAPGGMLSWVVGQLIELKVEEQRGQCESMSVEEALEKARASDLADHQRYKNRKPKKPSRSSPLGSAAGPSQSEASPPLANQSILHDMMQSMQEDMFGRRI